MSENVGNPVARWFRKLNRGAPAVRTDVQDAAQPIAACQERHVVELVGTVRALDVQDEEGHRALRAQLSDDSGSVTLLWMGRVAIPGVEVGRKLRVAGRIAQVDGAATIFNPRYELLA